MIKRLWDSFAVGKPFESANLLKLVLHPRRSVYQKRDGEGFPHILAHPRTSSAQTMPSYYIQSVEESQPSAITR
jgi:hypothetical protein